MKINEIIVEGRDDLDWDLDQRDRLDGGDDPHWGWSVDDTETEEEMNLSSNADTKMINAVKRVCDEFKGQGHAQVEMLPFLSKVMKLTKKPVNLADLIAINKKSPQIRSMIDSIDDKKIKFKNMSVKNEDPAKKQEKKDATVSGMASRAMGSR
jgi:hypothetical protein